MEGFIRTEQNLNFGNRRVRPPSHSYTYMRQKLRERRSRLKENLVPNQEELESNAIPINNHVSNVTYGFPPPMNAFGQIFDPSRHPVPHNFAMWPLPPPAAFPLYPPVPAAQMHVTQHEKAIEESLRLFIHNMNQHNLHQQTARDHPVPLMHQTNGPQGDTTEYSRLCAEQAIKAALGISNYGSEGPPFAAC